MKKEKLSLPNHCSASQLAVSPSNWQQLKKVKGPWRVHYRFYDPAYPKPKQVAVKVMNSESDIARRKEATKVILEYELKLLQSGYNPFHKQLIPENHQEGCIDITPNSFFVDALKRALERRKDSLAQQYFKHIKGYVLPAVEKAATQLGYNTLFISDVKRRHIIFILDHLKYSSSRFSDNTYNRFRTDLNILFEELVEVEAVEHNIIKEIRKKSYQAAPRKVLTNEQRVFIDSYLNGHYPAFHRFLNIFFHSGIRLTEMVRLRGSDVNLKDQCFRTSIEKGKSKRTAWRPIKTIALEFWRLAMENCGQDDFVFSTNLEPGKEKISEKQITRRWYAHVKKQFVYIAGRKEKRANMLTGSISSRANRQRSLLTFTA
jgi:integrase